MSAAHVRSYLASSARWQFSCALAATFPLTTILYSAELKLPPPLTVSVDYIKDVKPLLEKHCYECHGNGKQQAGLRLDLRQNALRGGDYGPVIVPGNSSKSKFIHKLVDGDGGDVMPPEGEPLTEAEIGLLRAWRILKVDSLTARTSSFQPPARRGRRWRSLPRSPLHWPDSN